MAASTLTGVVLAPIDPAVLTSSTVLIVPPVELVSPPDAMAMLPAPAVAEVARRKKVPVEPTVEPLTVIGVVVDVFASEKKADPCAFAVRLVVLMEYVEVAEVPIVPAAAPKLILPAVTVSPAPVNKEVALFATTL